MPEVFDHLYPRQRFRTVIFFGILISLVEVYAQYSLKSRRQLIGIIGYICVALILFKSYDYEALGHMNLVWSCISIITCFILGVLIFKEPFNKYTFLSVCFAISAIVLGYFSDQS
jgi:multidrug transporter EmrE-like cation transporter